MNTPQHIDQTLRVILNKAPPDSVSKRIQKAINTLHISCDEASETLLWANKGMLTSLYILALEKGYFEAAQMLHGAGLMRPEPENKLRGHLDVAILCVTGTDVPLDQMISWMLTHTNEVANPQKHNPFTRTPLVNVFGGNNHIHPVPIMQAVVEHLMAHGASLQDAFGDTTIEKWINTNHRKTKHFGRSLTEWKDIEKALHTRRALEQQVEGISTKRSARTLKI